MSDVKRCKHRITTKRKGRVRCHRESGHSQRWCMGWGQRGGLFQWLPKRKKQSKVEEEK